MEQVKEVSKENKVGGLSLFVIKIIAIISMTFDHIGYFMTQYNLDDLSTLSYVFRAFGRLAFPLFVFCLIEGVTHTKDIKKYMMRMGLSALFVYIGMTLIQVLFKFDFGYQGNVFLTLFLLIVIYYFLFKSKHKWLIILPILYILGTYATKYLFVLGYYTMSELPFFIYVNGLYCEYEVLALILFFFTLLGYKLYDNAIKKRLGDDSLMEAFKTSKEYQRSKNGIICIIIVILTVLCYLITYLPLYEETLIKISNLALESFMILACIPLIFYNGTLGYSNKVVKHGFYIYYPLHLGIIALIFWLIFK